MDTTTTDYVLIIVGVILGAIIVFLVADWLIDRKRRRKHEDKYGKMPSHEEQVDRLKSAIEVMDILNEDLEERKKRDNQK